MSENKEEFRRGIGGSDAAKILGVSKFGGPIDVYRKIVEGHDYPENIAMTRGKLLEPVIRELYRMETGAALEGPKRIRKDWARASLDDVAIREGQRIVVEYKSANIRQAHEWGDADDDIPTDYRIQVAWYLHWSGLARADLAVFLGGADLHIYPVSRDLELESMVLEGCERFYRDHIVAKKPPEVDGSWSCSEWLKERYPVDKGPVIQADEVAEEWARKLFAARAAKERAEKDEYEARNKLISRIGDAAGIEGDGWRISYTQTKGKPTLDVKALCAAFGIKDSDLSRYEKRTPYRMFRPTERKS
jgi:putative phage-type endonuclease